jgi:tetratricopeptide (TPR) repeat protein
MPQPSVDTQFNSLIDRLNSLQEDDQPSLEFEIKKLRREAEKLKSADPAQAFAILGIIACFEGNVPDMHRYHKNALRYSGATSLHLANYATSLNKCKLPEEALEYAKKAYENSQSDLGMRKAALGMVIELAYLLGKFEEYLSYNERWVKLTKEKHPFTILHDFSEKYRLHGHLQTAIKLINDCFEGSTVKNLKIGHDPETDEEWLIVQCRVRGNIKDILNSYDRYTDMWISSVPWPEREKIRLSYIAV